MTSDGRGYYCHKGIPRRASAALALRPIDPTSQAPSVLGR